jgi:ankyrin repeat protein
MQAQNKVWELVEMCFYGHLEEVKKILSEGVDVNAKAYTGHTPLMAAIEGENPEIVEYLLSVGAKNK